MVRTCSRRERGVMKTNRILGIIGSALLMLSPTTWAFGHGGGGGGFGGGGHGHGGGGGGHGGGGGFRGGGFGGGGGFHGGRFGGGTFHGGGFRGGRFSGRNWGGNWRHHGFSNDVFIGGYGYPGWWDWGYPYGY